MNEQKRPGSLRSPNYPNISLSDAIDRIRIIYPQQRRSPGDREVYAKILGYNGLTGSSTKIVSSLSKYGLLEGSGENLRASDVGEILAIHTPEDDEFRSALTSAANAPAFFREMWEEFPDGLPSEHSVKAYLLKRGFHEHAISPAI